MARPRLAADAGRTLSLPQRAALEQALRHNRKLNTIELMQQDLTALWHRSGTSKEQLLAQLEDWCRSAEGSGIDVLREFSRALQSYDLALDTILRLGATPS